MIFGNSESDGGDEMKGYNNYHDLISEAASMAETGTERDRERYVN